MLNFKTFSFVAIALFWVGSAKAQNALSLDGTNDFVQTTYSGISGNSARTVEAWINTTANANPSNGGSQQIITDWGGTSTGARFTFNVLWADAIRLEVAGNGLSGTIAVNDGQWHHVACVYDPMATNSVKLYVDGVLDVEGNLTVSVSTGSTVDMRIGNRVDGARYFDGEIDEVRVWSTAMSQSQISSAMSNELCNLGSTLEAYYTFNQGTAAGTNTGLTVLNDESGNGNNGTLTNFALSGATSNWVAGAPIGAGFTSSFQTVSNCTNYFWSANNVTYTSSGNYIANLTNAAGCDSTAHLDLTVTSNNSGTIFIDNCGPYVWASTGMTYSTSGVYTDSGYTNAAGCDSVAILDLTVGADNTGSETVNSCGTFTWPANGLTYTQTGTYTETVTNASGCDSVITLNLTVTLIDTAITTNGLTQLSVAQTSGTYQWIDCATNMPISGATSSSYTPTVDGSYACILTDNSCSDTTRCITITNVGIEDFDKEVIRMYQEGKTLTLVPLTKGKNAVELIDVAGRTHYSTEVWANTPIVITTEDYPKGIYFVRLRNVEHQATLKVMLR